MLIDMHPYWNSFQVFAVMQEEDYTKPNYYMNRVCWADANTSPQGPFQTIGAAIHNYKEHIAARKSIVSTALVSISNVFSLDAFRSNKNRPKPPNIS